MSSWESEFRQQSNSPSNPEKNNSIKKIYISLHKQDHEVEQLEDDVLITNQILISEILPSHYNTWWKRRALLGTLSSQSETNSTSCGRKRVNVESFEQGANQASKSKRSKASNSQQHNPIEMAKAGFQLYLEE